MDRKSISLSLKKYGLLWKLPLFLVLIQIVTYPSPHNPLVKIFLESMWNFFTVKTGTPFSEFNYQMFIMTFIEIDFFEIIQQFAIITVLLIFVFFVDRFRIKELGLTSNLASLFKFIGGALITSIFMFITFSLLAITGFVNIVGFFWDINPLHDPLAYIIIYQVLLLVAVAFQEELLFRAYIFLNLKWLRPIYAILISSILFSLIHLLGADQININVIIGLFNFFLFGLIYGYYFHRTGDLWLIIGAHFGWNFTMGSILGFSISGDASKGIFVTQLVGNPIFSGGQFGPEGGIITTLTILIMGSLLFLLKK